MQKIIKGTILVILMILIAACSSRKMVNNNDKSTMSTSTNMDIDVQNDIVSSNGQDHIQMLELQRNNVVYFDLDKYDIHPEFTKMLCIHANFLRNHSSYKVTIEGHADERGTPEYNIALGERRAKAVKMYLQGKGIPVDQISIISYGKEKQAVLGHNEAAYAKNRRAVLVY